MDRRFIAFCILLFVVGLGTVILAVNKVTLHAYDSIGSDYWLAYFATVSGIATICLAWGLIRAHVAFSQNQKLQ